MPNFTTMKFRKDELKHLAAEMRALILEHVHRFRALRYFNRLRDLRFYQASKLADVDAIAQQPRLRLLELQPPAIQTRPGAGTAAAIAKAEFDKSFPLGAVTLQTDGSGLLCGWNAVINSMRAQHPELPCPTLKELEEALKLGMAINNQDVEYDAETLAELNRMNYVSSDQISLAVETWGRSRSLNLEVGILVSSAL